MPRAAAVAPLGGMNPRKPPAALEGRARDLTHGGDAAIETAQGIVLARGALPGERVRVALGKRVAGALRGSLLEILEPSPDRVAAPCPEAERCGGCPLMTLAQPAQARFKRERLQRVLDQRGVALAAALIESPHALGYRARARLSFHARDGGARLGYREAASHAVHDVPRCLTLSAPLARGYAHAREQLAAVLQGKGEIALGLGAGERCAIDVACEAPQPPAVYAAAERLAACEGVAGVALRIGFGKEAGAPATWGDPRQCSAGADGLPLWAPPGAFMQANPSVNAELVTCVARLAEPEGARVLELYAGHGNLSVALARGALELRAVESERDAAEACRQNLLARGLSHARVTCDDAARGAAGKAPVDVVVLDPPRTGAREALPAILARAPSRIVYVSCDLGSLRRDLGELLAAGYRADAALALDMFPQTPHLESVVRLRR
jgi:23S rRNA (uracil1939-C5)-methyltransferase